jgi:hypothetical protein
MGISANCIKFLNYSKLKGVDFDKTLTLGRQQIFLSEKARQHLITQFKNQELPVNGGFAEPLFHLLGANEVESMDYSDFENATIIHDLSVPVSKVHTNVYSTIFDGGTLEHVFNFPIAIKNCMDMLRVGGHFIAITPANNYCGHGFYQFSPELYFALFTKVHGFNLKQIVVVVENKPENQLEWFEVRNPKSVGERVTIINSYPTAMMVIAEKIMETDNISINPLQSDYQSAWAIHNSTKANTEVKNGGTWINYYRRWVPEIVRDIVYKLRSRSLRKKYVNDFGFVNPSFFTKLDV